MADDVKVSIVADIKSLLTGLDSASKATKKTTEEMSLMGRDVGATFNKLKGAFIALAAVIGGAAFLKSTVKETVDWTVESQKLARVLGITTEKASVLNLAIGDIYGTSEEYLGAVSKLTRTLNTNEGAFHKLGVETRDSGGHLRATSDIMTDTNTALAGMKSGTDRNIESSKIYGKSWMEVQRYLGLTTEVMQAAQEKAEKLNLIVGQDSVKATAAYRASMNDLEDTVKGLKIRIGNELLPVLTTLNNDMADEGPSAVQALGTAFRWFYAIILGLREEFEAFSVNLSYLWHGITLGIAQASAQGAAIMRGNFAEAKAIGDAAAAWEITRARATANELQAIADKYTAKAMILYGLGPKRKIVTPPDPPDRPGGGGGSTGGTGGTTGKAASGVDADGLTSSQNADAKAAAATAKKIAQDKAAYLNDMSREEVESQQKAIADINAAWERNTVKGGLTAWLRESKQGLAQLGTFTKAAMQSITAATSASIAGLIKGTMSWGSALKNVFSSAMDSMINFFVQWGMKEIATIVATAAAHRAASAAKVTENAAEAGTAGMKSAAEIPVVGWAIAIGAGLAIFAAASGLASAAGGWDRVPSDQMAMIHKNEMVLPADLAEGARQTFAGGGGGGDQFHLHFPNVYDRRGFERMASDNVGSLLKVLKSANLNNRK